MNHTATIELSFSVDGREPTQGELDAILTQIIQEWPTWVFAYGDDSDENGAAVLEQIAASWEATR